MAICYTNSTTERLEGFARSRGLYYGIIISPNNKSGRFFISTIEGKVLTRWISLGWTKKDAEKQILEDLNYQNIDWSKTYEDAEI